MSILIFVNTDHDITDARLQANHGYTDHRMMIDVKQL